MTPRHDKLAILRAASAAGVAPRIVHVDEARRAILSERIALLADTLRRVHALPIPPAMAPRDTHALLGRLRSDLPQPGFVADAQARMLAEPIPDGGPPVLSHNDLNPSNLLFDGERVVLLDWDVAGPNDAAFDAATLAVFLRLDDPALATLLGGDISPRFRYDRRLVATLCGSIFLKLAREAGFPGATDDDGESLAAAYLRMRSGGLDLAAGAGKWSLGLALLREAAGLR